jgi:dolichol-phosphate mannosyltransferase
MAVRDNLGSTKTAGPRPGQLWDAHVQDAPVLPTVGQPWIVIPTYNEAENIGNIIDAVLTQAGNFNMLVVDDNSPDGTADIANARAQKNPGRVDVLRRQKKDGYGRAVFAGFKAALDRGATYIFSMDCDWSHHPKDLPRLLEALAKFDVVVGSRYVPGGRTVNWPLSRRIMSRLANFTARTLAGLPAHDCTGGFRGYRRSVVERLIRQPIRSTTYTFLTETLFYITKMGYRIGEIPIVFKDREFGQSKVDARLIMRSGLNLLQVGSKRLRGHKPRP